MTVTRLVTGAIQQLEEISRSSRDRGDPDNLWASPAS